MAPNKSLKDEIFAIAVQTAMSGMYNHFSIQVLVFNYIRQVAEPDEEVPTIKEIKEIIYKGMLYTMVN